MLKRSCYPKQIMEISCNGMEIHVLNSSNHLKFLLLITSEGGFNPMSSSALLHIQFEIPDKPLNHHVVEMLLIMGQNPIIMIIYDFQHFTNIIFAVLYAHKRSSCTFPSFLCDFLRRLKAI